MTSDIIVDLPTIGGDTVQPGQFLRIKLTQDGTGGWKPTWGTTGDYIGMANQDIDLTPDTYSIFEFSSGADGKFGYTTGSKGNSIT